MQTATPLSLVEALDAKIAEFHLLKSPFYQAWTAGTLTRESLALYAAQYYQHVRAFPGYLQTLAERADASLRPLVQENLDEELDAAGSHPKLWRDFAAAAGADEKALESAQPLPQVAELVSTYRHICAHGTLAEAVAALYAYEAQVPEIAGKKMDGLRSHYGITDAAGLRYFAVHEEADVRHRAAWRQWLAAQTDADQERVLVAAERGLKALWAALEAVYSGPCAN